MHYSIAIYKYYIGTIEWSFGAPLDRSGDHKFRGRRTWRTTKGAENPHQTVLWSGIHDWKWQDSKVRNKRGSSSSLYSSLLSSGRQKGEDSKGVAVEVLPAPHDASEEAPKKLRSCLLWGRVCVREQSKNHWLEATKCHQKVAFEVVTSPERSLGPRWKSYQRCRLVMNC